MIEYLNGSAVQAYRDLKQRHAYRDITNSQVSEVRRGNVDAVLPGVFPSNWSRPVVANVLDTTARQLAETLARLPQIECVTANTTSDAAKKFAAKKTKLAHYYVNHSRLKSQFLSGADWFFTYGAMPVIVEADFEASCPIMRIDNPVGAYWDLDLRGRVKLYAKAWVEPVASLCAKFPEAAGVLRPKQDPFSKTNPNASLEVVKLYTPSKTVLMVPEREGLVLASAPNPLGRVPVEIAERPKWDDENRGALDDVIWIYLAKARMAAYQLEATHKAVRAPIAVPDDMDQLALGDDAIIRTNEPEKVRRVNLELPQSPLVENATLDAELSAGTRVPKAATGQVDASIITGQGVEALAGAFSTQIGAAQELIGECLRRSIEMCFEFDEVLWPNLKKTVNGTAHGAPFSETYVPSKDIKGDYSVSVTYGFTAGMDANRALVFLLQMRGDQAIDRDTLQQNLPFDVDIEQLQRRIDTEQIEDALKQGVFAYITNAPMMAAQGMGDPVEAFQKVAEIVKARNKGETITEAVIRAFKPKEQPAASPEEQAIQQMLGQAGGGPAPEEPSPYGFMGEGGSPDLQMMLASLSSTGKPILQSAVSRRMPA